MLLIREFKVVSLLMEVYWVLNAVTNISYSPWLFILYMIEFLLGAAMYLSIELEHDETKYSYIVLLYVHAYLILYLFCFVTSSCSSQF